MGELADRFEMVVPVLLESGLHGYRPEQTRIRMNYKISAKGLFQPDITSEAETVETAMANLRKAREEMSKFAVENGWKEGAE